MGYEVRRIILSIENIFELPPILVSPIEGELLTLYLVVSDFSTSAVLFRDKDRVQHPVYYCNRALRGEEERYPRMEKLILALVTAARKLRPYFQAHTIEVPTEYPMKQVLHKPDTSGRMMKWAIELSETKNCNKRAGLSKLRHGIHLSRACRERSNADRPPHLETLCRWGNKRTRKRSRSNPDLPRRNRY